MTTRNSSWRSVAALLAEANRQKQAVATAALDDELRRLDQVVHYTPEDLTITAQAGMTLAALQDSLRAHAQWLPVDPPHPDKITLEDLLSWNLSGPRRYGYGTIREHVLGVKYLLADGTLAATGGRVVKNVAGYDLARLLIGARRTLGVPVEITFKLLPRPQAESWWRSQPLALSEAETLLRILRGGNLQAAALDLTPEGKPIGGIAVGPLRVWMCLAGTVAEEKWQRQESHGGAGAWEEQPEPGYESAYWQDTTPMDAKMRHWSVLPSRLAEALRDLPCDAWLARAGNGVIYYVGGEPPPTPRLADTLMNRMKEMFDPHQTLPALPW